MFLKKRKQKYEENLNSFVRSIWNFWLPVSHEVLEKRDTQKPGPGDLASALTMGWGSELCDVNRNVLLEITQEKPLEYKK